jgi:P27 family predicted phage terminase small subunit
VGRRGPPPKPTALKKREGTYRKDRAAHAEIVAPPGAPPLPSGLAPEASARWEELVPILLERGTLSKEDGAILESHCRAYAMWRRYQALAEKQPMIKTPWGKKVNPAAEEARQWESRSTQTGDRLGLNASARSRVGKPGSNKPPAPTAMPADGTPLVGPSLRVVEGSGPRG